MDGSWMDGWMKGGMDGREGWEGETSEMGLEIISQS